MVTCLKCFRISSSVQSMHPCDPRLKLLFLVSFLLHKVLLGKLPQTITFRQGDLCQEAHVMPT